MGNYKQSGTKFYGYGNSHSKGKGGPKFNIMGMLDKAKGFMGGGATKYTSPAKDYDIDKGSHGHPHDTPTEYSTPAKSGLGATVKKGGVKSEFDIDDAMDLKKQNKAKEAELLKKYRNKEISADEYHSDIREIASYENPE